jgi:hypothetical protein
MRSRVVPTVLVVLGIQAAPALADNQPPFASDDHHSLIPTLKAQVNVLANDTDPDGDPLVITSHGDPSLGTVDCDATTCTYTPPPRASLPDENSDVVLEPEQPDSFTYTVSDGKDANATATVVLDPAVPTTRKGTAKGATNRGCNATTFKRPKTPQTTGGDGGGAITYARSSRCRRHLGSTHQPPATPIVNGPEVGAPGSRAFTAANPFAWTAFTRYPFDFGSRCHFKSTLGVPYEPGGFGVWSWMRENGPTGINRMKISYRVQVYGTNYYGQGAWVTMNANFLSVSNKFPDSNDSWIPAHGWYQWVNQPWGQRVDYVVENGPWRLQTNHKWIHRRDAPLPDKVVVNSGWGTRCQGQPSIE